MRKEAIDFYHQKNQNLRSEINNSCEELLPTIYSHPREKRSASEVPKAPATLLQEESSEPVQQPPQPDQNALNLRQIDELSESESISSGNSTKNSRFLMKGSAQVSQHVEEKLSNVYSFGHEADTLRKKSSLQGTSIMLALERNNEEITKLRA